MLLLLRFFRSSEVAIRVVSTRRESDKLDAASLFKKRESSLFQIKNLKIKTSWFKELFGIVWWFVKMIFLNDKNAWLTFY